jgi:glutamine transport system substrate-binding protein
MQWIARLSLLYLGAVVFITGCAPNNTLKVGIESNFRPFTYTESGEPKGFEVELWEAMAKKANIKYELVPVEVAEMSKSLKSGDVDLAIAGMTVNKARKDALDFSDPYFQTGLVLVVSKDNDKIKNKGDLKDKKVATVLGSTAYVYAGNIEGVKEVRGYPEIEQAYDELAEKKIDAVIFDERNVHDYLQTRGSDKAKIVGEPLNKESYAIVSKKHSKHIGRVNDAIAAVVKDGTYEALYEKYFGNKPKKLPGD